MLAFYGLLHILFLLFPFFSVQSHRPQNVGDNYTETRWFYGYRGTSLNTLVLWKMQRKDYIPLYGTD